MYPRYSSPLTYAAVPELVKVGSKLLFREGKTKVGCGMFPALVRVAETALVGSRSRNAFVVKVIAAPPHSVARVRGPDWGCIRTEAEGFPA